MFVVIGRMVVNWPAFTSQYNFFTCAWLTSSLQDVPGFVLTREEKRVILFVVVAFALGVATKLYRDTHPPAPAKINKPSVSYAQGGSSAPSASPKKGGRKPRD
jgi:hypothetical protein